MTRRHRSGARRFERRSGQPLRNVLRFVARLLRRCIEFVLELLAA